MKKLIIFFINKLNDIFSCTFYRNVSILQTILLITMLIFFDKNDIDNKYLAFAICLIWFFPYEFVFLSSFKEMGNYREYLFNKKGDK